MRSTRSPSSIERLLGLGPLAPPPHAFALDGERLRYGAFAREGGGYRFREYHVEELPPASFQQGPLGGPFRDPAVADAALGRLLERLAGPVKEASLVVPDAWLRMVFAESGDLPAAARERDDVLRWKLKRLVPFRVEELRIDAVEVTRLPGQEEPRRLLIGFAAEALVAQLEAAFARAGVRLGRIVNTSLAVAAALDVADGDGLTALVVAETADGGGDRQIGGGYSLAVLAGDEVMLHRYKGLAAGLPAAARGDFVRRDLALTRNFLAENAPGSRVTRAYFSGPGDADPAWLTWLEEGLGAPADLLGGDHLPPVAGASPNLPWHEVAPMLGAVHQEVA